MDALFKYFAKRIIIELSPEKFTFLIKEKNISISFAPFMYLEKDELIWIPIAIGNEIPVENGKKPDIVRFDISDLKDTMLSNSVINSEVFLQLLFEYGIGRCFESFWFPQLKPVVIIFGSDQFNEYFRNPKELFELVAKKGGARYVVFDNMEL